MEFIDKVKNINLLKLKVKFEMKEKDKKQLFLLLEKAIEEGLIHIYDSNENTYDVDWLWSDSTINIKIKET